MIKPPQLCIPYNCVTSAKKLCDNHPKMVTSYLSDKTGTLGFFIDQIMIESRGTANPRLAKQAILDELENRKIINLKEVIMDIKESLVAINNLFKNRDWFHSVEVINNKIIVYVDTMSGDILRAVPNSINGHEVFLHYARSKVINKTEFIYNPQPYLNLVAMVPDGDDTFLAGNPKVEELSSELLEYDITELVTELDRLEKICGVNTLADIFFEEHDGINAVTNLSARYPEVKSAIHKLYEIYGFDIIYEEL